MKEAIEAKVNQIKTPATQELNCDSVTIKAIPKFNQEKTLHLSKRKGRFLARKGW